MNSKTFLLTRIDTGDYDAWKAVFDEDPPQARAKAKGHRIRRGVDNPNEVFVQVEFDSVEDAKEAREKLLASGIVDRFGDRTGPTVVQEAEAVGYGA